MRSPSSGPGRKRTSPPARAPAAAGSAAVIVLLVPARRSHPSPATREAARVEPIAPPTAPRQPVQSPQFLKIAADLCTEFGRVRDVDDLKRLLAQVANIMG